MKTFPITLEKSSMWQTASIEGKTLFITFTNGEQYKYILTDELLNGIINAVKASVYFIQQIRNKINYYYNYEGEWLLNEV